MGMAAGRQSYRRSCRSSADQAHAPWLQCQHESRDRCNSGHQVGHLPALGAARISAPITGAATCGASHDLMRPRPHNAADQSYCCYRLKRRAQGVGLHNRNAHHCAQHEHPLGARGQAPLGTTTAGLQPAAQRSHGWPPVARQRTGCTVDRLGIRPALSVHARMTACKRIRGSARSLDTSLSARAESRRSQGHR